MTVRKLIKNVRQTQNPISKQISKAEIKNNVLFDSECELKKIFHKRDVKYLHARCFSPKS
jgi:hypothetical protein